MHHRVVSSVNYNPGQSTQRLGVNGDVIWTMEWPFVAAHITGKERYEKHLKCQTAEMNEEKDRDDSSWK